MNINWKRATRALFASAALAAVMLVRPAAAEPINPDPIDNLTIQPGTQAGSVVLTWTARGDDLGAEPATRYIIKYRFNNAITTEPEWANAYTVDSPPVNVSPPTPLPNGATQTLLVTGLQPGVVYGFAMKVVDEIDLISTLSNSATAQASAPCVRDPNDGLGVGSATLLPTAVESGEMHVVTMTVVVNGSGIDTGGKIMMRVPDFFPIPTVTAAGSPGHVTYSISAAGAGLDLSSDGPNVTLEVTSGTIPTSTVVKFYYNAQTCQSGVHRYTLATQFGSCGVLTDTGQSGTTSVGPGMPRFIDFQNFELTALVGQVTPVDMRVVDQCGNPVTVAASTTVVVSAAHFVGANLFPDPLATVSLASSPYAGAQAVTLTINSGSSGGRLYYRITSAANKPQNRLHITQIDLQNSNNGWPRTIPIRPLASGITNSSVDSGTFVAGQKTVTFSPDNDGVADAAAINFTLPERLPWIVEISSNGFSSITRRLFGDAQNARILWDGHQDGSPGVPPTVAPPGTYAIRISVNNSALVDSTLSATLSAFGMTGMAWDNLSSPLSDVEVEIFGPTNRYTRTAADGTFTVYGLKAGNYQVRYRKTGYSYLQTTPTLASGILVLPTATLTRESILRLVIERPAADSMEEVWGQVRANNSDWTKQAWGTVHFGRGKTRADAGDLYNTEPTSHTALTLAPNVLYRIKFEIPNLSTTDFNVMLAANADEFYPVMLQPRANIEGLVSVASGTNPSGLWISVEAGPDANLDLIFDNQDPSRRYWGGAWLAPNESQATYRIFGVANGSYSVVASAPNYIAQRANVVISNDQNGTLNFPPLSTGGVVTGTITVPGDSSDLDSMDGTTDGYFRVPINVWSASLQTGSFRQVSVATGSAGTTAVFMLTGLADGTYEVYSNLQGYELNPPGRRTVTVTGGAGSLNLTYQAYSGGLTGTIDLGGPTNYSSAEISLQPYDWNLGGFSSPSIVGDTYTFSQLGTGFYRLRARYPDTGFIVERNLQIVNGLVAQADLDLSGDTFDISGRVTTSARSPYNALDYLVNGSTPTRLRDSSTQANVSLPANRIVAELVERKNRGGGGPNDNDPTVFDGRTTFFGYYDATDGSYSIENLTPGTYRLRNNGEMNDTFPDGKEVAETSLIVKLLTGNATGQDLNISDGYTVSGTIRVADGSVPNRDIRVELKNAVGTTIASRNVFMSSTEMTFTLDRVPSGDYILSTIDNGQPRAYSAKDVRAVLDGANLTNVQVELLKAAKILGRLRIKTSGILLTARNFNQFLSDDFFIEARSNPWFNGGFGRSSHPTINDEGNFVVTTNPGKYDVLFRADSGLSPQDVSRGKKQFVPLKISGIEVAAGQTYDLGVVELYEGTAIKGTVRNKSGTPLPNILVIAKPSGASHYDDPLQSVTNELGQYSIQGADSTVQRYYDVIASPRSDDGRFSGYTGTIYGEVRRTQVDTTLPAPIDFMIEPALGILRARLVTPDGGALETPFDHDQHPGGVVIMNRVGNIPQGNPLGDIEEDTAADGTVEVRGLAPGTYTLWGLAKGYANGLVRNIVIGNGVTDIGDVTLRSGFTLSGALFRADGTAPNESDLDTLVAVRQGFEDLLIGQTVKDSAGAIISYQISGFEAGKPYTVLAFDSADDVLVLTDGLIVNSDTQLDFTLTERQPSVLAQASKAGDGSIVIHFEFTRPLRNSPTDLDGLNGPDDSEGPNLIALTSGGGVLTHPTDFLAYDRRRARVVYVPAAGDSRFTITVNAAFETIDSATGENYTVSKAFPFFLGIGKQKEQKFSNAGGGVVQLEEDTSEFSAQAGTFGTAADDEVSVIFRVADQASEFDGVAASPAASRAMAVASRLGLKSYPPDMAGAINRVKTTAVDPFSSFYDIFLPAGVSHFFPEGREARLCVAYDSDATDPYSLNVYYFNTETDEFLLESENKTVDVDNQRICVSLGHASVFTVLASSAAVISGAGYTGELAVMNFPNPFNLKAKTVTLQNPGSASASQDITGTMIKVSVPPNIAGGLEIEIYSVSGERVRTIRDNVPVGGAHYYLEWDGKNDSGAKVASGTYVARMTIGGGDERFFKMAVLK